MLKTILIWLFIGMVIILAATWLYAGGYREIVAYVRTVPNPIDIIWGNSTSTYRITLPWELPVPQGPDISQYAEEAGGAEYEQDVEAVRAEAAKARTYGNPSRYAGAIRLSAASANESDPVREYVEIDASAVNSADIDLTGWSLQSMVSGRREYLPQAASPFISGAVNEPVRLTLSPGASVIVTSAPSPVGISFRENVCTGYLSQLQEFEPPLSNMCPSDGEIAPMTPENLRRYGSACFDYIRSLPACDFPRQMPAGLSGACRAFVANSFSYNGCVNLFRHDTDFALDTWRAYLGSSVQLWSDSHDIIRLLDESGRTVDVVSY